MRVCAFLFRRRRRRRCNSRLSAAAVKDGFPREEFAKNQSLNLHRIFVCLSMIGKFSALFNELCRIMSNEENERTYFSATVTRDRGQNGEEEGWKGPRLLLLSWPSVFSTAKCLLLFCFRASPYFYLALHDLLLDPNGGRKDPHSIWRERERESFHGAIRLPPTSSVLISSPLSSRLFPAYGFYPHICE